MKDNVYRKSLIKGIGVSALLAVCYGAVAVGNLCWEDGIQPCWGRTLTKTTLAGVVECYDDSEQVFLTAYIEVPSNNPGYSQTEYGEATCSWSCTATDGAGRKHLLEESDTIGTYNTLGEKNCGS